MSEWDRIEKDAQDRTDYYEAVLVRCAVYGIPAFALVATLVRYFLM